MASRKVVVNTGDRFGQLVIIRELEVHRRPSGGTCRMFLCKCDCGSEAVVRLSNLRCGRTTSCGCYRPVVVGHVDKEHPMYHGMAQSAEYGIWKGMKKRCYRKSARGYPNYGGRGIRVCDRWLHSFKNFIDDMGPRPSSEHSIDRIDGDGDYEPSNCRWVTRKEQNRNRKDNRFFEYRGERLCLSDWAKRYGIRKTTLLGRLDRGMTIGEALTTPVRQWTRSS